MIRVPVAATIAAGCLAVLLAPQAMAAGSSGFVIVPYTPVPSTPAVGSVPASRPATAAPLSIPAERPGPASSSESSNLEGYGDSIPLSFALDQIIPSGFIVHYDNGIDKTTAVSWRGGRPWRDVLTTTLASDGLKADVQGQMVFIHGTSQPRPAEAISANHSESPAPVRQPAPTREAVADAGSTGAAPEPRFKKPVVAPRTSSPTIRVPVAKQTVSYGPASGGDGVYFAATGDTLSSVLQRWAALNGWTAVYDTDIVYQLQAGASFEGDFMTASAALIKSINATPRPLAHFYRGNNVLRVYNAEGSNN